VPWAGASPALFDRYVWRVDGGGDVAIRGPTSAGFNVTITGSNFGPESEDLDVTIDDDHVTPLMHNQTHVLFTMPPGLGVRHVSVAVKGQVSAKESLAGLLAGKRVHVPAPDLGVCVLTCATVSMCRPRTYCVYVFRRLRLFPGTPCTTSRLLSTHWRPTPRALTAGIPFPCWVPTSATRPCFGWASCGCGFTTVCAPCPWLTVLLAASVTARC
jgi:hypothetical protein